MKNWDVTLGLIGGLSVALLNSLVGLACGALTVGILWFRLRREYRHRNDPPEK